MNIATLGFQRYARLLINLPAESRFIRKVSPLKDWNWDKEMQAQILHAIDSLSVLYVNANRKKGTAKQKPPKLVQPDYVEKAKKELKAQMREDAKTEQAELAEVFAKRNNKVAKEIKDA